MQGIATRLQEANEEHEHALQQEKQVHNIAVINLEAERQAHMASLQTLEKERVSFAPSHNMFR